MEGLRKWHSRQDFRLQPPRSKRGALYIELQEHGDDDGNGAPGRLCSAFSAVSLRRSAIELPAHETR